MEMVLGQIKSKAERLYQKCVTQQPAHTFSLIFIRTLQERFYPPFTGKELEAHGVRQLAEVMEPASD